MAKQTEDNRTIDMFDMYICEWCSGSGEGETDGTVCHFCNGTGLEMYGSDSDDYWEEDDDVTF